MNKPVFSGYEQSVLTVGQDQNGLVFTQKHLHQLAKLKAKLPAGMYRLEYQSVRWGNYVGLVELPDVIFEILPKVDRSSDISLTRSNWTNLLQQFDFLPQIGNLNPQLLMQPGKLTESIQRSFLKEVNCIVKRGLSRQYRSQQGQQQFLRGKLLLPQQIRTNLIHKHQFYVQAQTRTLDHPLNQRIKLTLQIIAKSSRFTAPANDLLRHFSSVSDISLKQTQVANSLNRFNQHYQVAVQLANLICKGYLGGTFAGQDFGFSLLFDMSQLFELLVYYHLKKLSAEREFTLHFQPQRNFWQTKNLRPDFLLNMGNGQRVVIDTKWKVLTHPTPNDEDLRQIFAYTQVFEVNRGILFYPQTGKQLPMKKIFNLPSAKGTTGEIQFLSILENLESQLIKILHI